MSFPAYPNYKDSGVEWLGPVPAHWEVKPLKHIAWIDSCGSYGVDPEEAEIVLPVATTAQIGSDGRFVVEQMPQRGFSPAEVKRFGCSDGDILVVKSSGSATNIISGKAGLVDSTTPAFVFSNFLMRVRPMLDQAAPKFVYAQLRSHLTRQRVELMCSTTTYPNLQIGQYTSAPLPIPPLPEQTRIAEFLDRETAKIDELVAEQRRLMELLKEKRQAVISHAVTRGLDPAAPLKPSGIDWLGAVPVHWEVKPLKYSITKIEQGWSPQCENRPADEDEWGVLKVGCGNGDRFDPTEQKALPIELAPETAYEVQAEDILMSRGNSLELVGMATFIEQVRPRLLLSDLLYRFRAKQDRANGRFIVMSLRSPNVRFQIEREATGTSASMKKIAQGNIREFVIPIPPLAEQTAIVAFLDAETAKFDALTAEAQRAIDLLQERRTALISAAVTGRIDVRAAA